MGGSWIQGIPLSFVTAFSEKDQRDCSFLRKQGFIGILFLGLDGVVFHLKIEIRSCIFRQTLLVSC
ncbi:MAG: hypothetical protein UZ16_OP3001001643 [Candidatus Hinthialibacteria bacterium OLB16]|nr:MAG: hypothetical protein UZ16_OP3001001643 [Candidatus Hinthialibacteria bacterium OLB16]